MRYTYQLSTGEGNFMFVVRPSMVDSFESEFSDLIDYFIFRRKVDRSLLKESIDLSMFDVQDAQWFSLALVYSVQDVLSCRDAVYAQLRKEGRLVNGLLLY